MLVGVPKEIKSGEFRVGLTPAGARELVAHGHQVLVQSDAASAIGFSDERYRQAGAEIVGDAQSIFERAELVVKVKEPQAPERALLREGQALFTYLHLAPDHEQLKELVASGVTAIAYETVRDASGLLPLLAPMSEVAGRLAIQAGAHSLEKTRGGAGVLLAGVAGVDPGNVLVLGGGVVGLNAARMAMGLGARVTLVDKSLPRLRYIDELYSGRIQTQYATIDMLERKIAHAELVVGAVLVPGAATPRLVTRDMLGQMKPGSVLVDVSIDQGGCFETSRPTTHENPTFVVDDIVHYCVANMPSAVARTATAALTAATLPYVLKLADSGWQQAMLDDPGLLAGLNVHRGAVTCQAVAEAQQQSWLEPEVALRQTPRGVQV